jgi:hypothetical protein
VSWLRINCISRWQLRAACAALGLMAAGASLSACGEASSGYDYETASHHEPAKLEPIKGTDIQRVIFDAEGAKRVGLKTVAVRQNGQETVIPFGAVIYDAEGNAGAYTVPEPLTFVRKEIEIDRMDGKGAVLSDGPPAGTKIVTVGTAEVYGTEFEVAH